MQEECEREAGQHEEIVAESILLAVICGLDDLVEAHQVADGERGDQEHNLHNCVVPKKC